MKPVALSGSYNDLDDKLVVDSELDVNSENLIQNKAVAEVLEKTRKITETRITTLPTPPTKEEDYFVTNSTDGTFPYAYGNLSIKYGSSTGEYVAIYQTTGTDVKVYYNMYRSDAWSGWRNIADGGNADTVDGKHASDFLALTGGAMQGPIQWNSASLPQASTCPFVLTIDAFADGGTMKWIASDNATVGNADTVDGKHATDFVPAVRNIALNNSFTTEMIVRDTSNKNVYIEYINKAADSSSVAKYYRVFNPEGTGYTDLRVVVTGTTSVWNFVCNDVQIGGKSLLSVSNLKNYTGISNLGWTDATTGGTLVPTINAIAYWNGAFSGTGSNLMYCKQGAFGNIVTRNYAAGTAAPTTATCPTNALYGQYS